MLSGLNYGPRAKDAVNKAVSLAPKSSPVWVARGVGNYYLPSQLGGGVTEAVSDFHKAIDLDSRNSEAWLWLAIALRKQNKDVEARQAFDKSLALDPNRVWVRQQLDKTPAK
jgi:predicted Zn-dependent protease